MRPRHPGASRRPSGPGSWDRVGFAVLGGVAAATLIVARLLSPAASGVGTHEQLGMPPCTFLLLTGHGCPGCGLTTSFALAARGRIAAAFAANPWGPVLFGLAALIAVAGIALAVRPVTTLDALLESRYLPWVVLALFAGMVLTWALRLALGVV